MPISVLPYLGTHARPLSSEEYELVRVSFDLGLQDVDSFEQEQSYERILRTRVQSQENEGESVNMTSLAGYAIGLRRGKFNLPEEIEMLWNEVSAYAISDLREGHAYGSRAASSTPDHPVGEIVDMTLDAFEKRLTPLGSSAAVLGSLAGIHAVDLKRRGEA
jgi:putative transposon-encoded protein